MKRMSPISLVLLTLASIVASRNPAEAGTEPERTLVFKPGLYLPLREPPLFLLLHGASQGICPR
jgi:hypothetical protein